MNEWSLLQNLRFSRYRVSLIPITTFHLNDFVGSTLRGAFGGVFRRLVCVTRLPVCEGCLLRNQCAYGYLFETAPPPQSARFRKYQDIPRPFVLEPPEQNKTTYLAGEEFAFNLVLIGRAMDYLPYFLFVFRELEKSGLGRGRKEGQGRFHLRQMTALLPQGREVIAFDPVQGHLTEVSACFTSEHLLSYAQRLPKTQLTLSFLTPTRIKFEGHLLKDFQFHHLIRALLRRLLGLTYFHCGAELNLDLRGLIQQAQAVEKVHDELRWQEQTRYSSRQRTEMQMGGFVGTATFEGDLTPFLPFLVAGEWVHIGKGCVMGLGRYCLSPVADPGRESGCNPLKF